MAAVDFPEITPSSRSYNPGRYPQEVFEAQNGAKTILRYGNKRVNATLSLGFSNITDGEATLILQNYEAVNSDWDHINFATDRGLKGIDDSTLSNYMKESTSGLKWRYAGPPTVTSVFKGRSNVKCNFVACLDGD